MDELKNEMNETIQEINDAVQTEIPAMVEEQPEEKKPFPWLLVVVGVLVIIAVVVALVFIFGGDDKLPETSEASEVSEVSIEVSEEESHVLVENPKDFKELKKQNEDIYAWITVDGTKVDYPVCQSPEGVSDDDYYLHRGLDKEYLFAGTIYTQKSYNKKDFSDRVTLVYGHSMLNKTMFGSLHSFADKSFFDAHDTITVYTEGHILTYKIVSTFVYTDDHLLLCYDNFKKDDVWDWFRGFIANPVGRPEAFSRPVEMDTNSKIITLSTCMSANGNTRYLVNGVLVDDQWTY